MTNDPTGHEEDGTSGLYDSISRRRLVVTGAATWATISLAGCTESGDGEGDGGDGGGETTTTVTATATTTTTDTVTQSTTTADGTTAATTTTTTTTETPTPTAAPTTTTTTAESGGGATTTTCSEGRRFMGGSPIGFLVGLFRTESGNVLGPDDADAVTIRFQDVDIPALELTWDGRHTVFDEDTWGGKLEDTVSLGPGTYHYDVVVAADGEERTVMSDQFVLVE